MSPYSSFKKEDMILIGLWLFVRLLSFCVTLFMIRPRHRPIYPMVLVRNVRSTISSGCITIIHLDWYNPWLILQIKSPYPRQTSPNGDFRCHNYHQVVHFNGIWSFVYNLPYFWISSRANMFLNTNKVTTFPGGIRRKTRFIGHLIYRLIPVESQ